MRRRRATRSPWLCMDSAIVPAKPASCNVHKQDSGAHPGAASVPLFIMLHLAALFQTQRQASSTDRDALASRRDLVSEGEITSVFT